MTGTTFKAGTFIASTLVFGFTGQASAVQAQEGKKTMEIIHKTDMETVDGPAEYFPAGSLSPASSNDQSHRGLAERSFTLSPARERLGIRTRQARH